MATAVSTTSARKHRKNVDEATNDNDCIVHLAVENEITNGDYSGDKDKASKPLKQHKVPIMNTILSAGRRIARSSSNYDRHAVVSSLQQEVIPAPHDENPSLSSTAVSKNQSRPRESFDDDLGSPSTNNTDGTHEKSSNDKTGIGLKVVINVLTKKLKSFDGKKIVSFVMLSLIALLILDTTLSSPENRIFTPDFSEKFLFWVQQHPAQGLLWIIFFMAIAVIVMIPIGTPITVGCGYIYKGAYGWKIGIIVATFVSMTGSAVGAVTCFLLGRYLMRDEVRKWIKKYPLFDAIDAASAEHGLRIMAMLYLTPILPLGPISYMCGTTSMTLSSFIIAKIAALPLMVLYVFIGASTGALIGKDASQTAEEVRRIEENHTLIISGILLSFVMIAFITHSIRVELNKILERQQKHKPGEQEARSTDDELTADEENNSGVEITNSAISAPRHRKH